METILTDCLESLKRQNKYKHRNKEVTDFIERILKKLNQKALIQQNLF